MIQPGYLFECAFAVTGGVGAAVFIFLLLWAMLGGFDK
jgi:hypothetical protein